MPYEFDANDNPELLPVVDQPGPMYAPVPDPMAGNYLSDQEAALLSRLYPDAYSRVFPTGSIDPLPTDVVRQLRNLLQQANENTPANLNAQGIPAQSRRQYMAGGPVSDGGEEDFHSEEIYGAGTATKKFPATNVPKAWRMVHQRAKGGHICYVSRTEAAYFTRKASANAFCRTWNEMMSHLGSAAEFDQLRLSSLFAAILQAGSGQSGLANGFRPPLNGQ